MDGPDRLCCARHGLNTARRHRKASTRNKEWGNRWNRDVAMREALLRQMHDLRLQALATTPRTWTTEAVLQSLSSMKGNRARGVDGWNPSEIMQLPRRAIDGGENPCTP